ncbi:MAG: hypothetical protein ACRC10_01105 [Thermoguttaceae bacterium]
MFDMSCTTDEIDDLIRNAELWTELEPYYDEAISRVDVRHLSLKLENEFLASMLDWETAPIVPVYRWFEPEMRLPNPDPLNDEDLHSILNDTVLKLFEKKIILDFTDHLSDRELYRLICLDILPSREKKLDNRNNYIHWDCSHAGGNPNIWLTYYASDEDRECWADVYRQPLPPKKVPVYHRDWPQDPLF